MNKPIRVKPVRAIYLAAHNNDVLIRNALFYDILLVPMRFRHYRMHGKGLRALLGALPRPLLEKVLYRLEQR